MRITLHNPFTGEQVFAADGESREQALQRATRAQTASSFWSQVPVGERVDLLRQALQYFEQHGDDIASGISREMGKPVAAAREELQFMLERAHSLCDFARDGALQAVDLGRYHDQQFGGRIEFRSKGVVYIISPWNYPLFCAINGCIAALLAGNAVLLKHATTPSVGAHFQQAFGQLGGINGLLQHVLVDYASSAELIEHGDINHVIFTGSVQGGQAITQSVARRCLNELRNPFIQCSLELGSSDAAYIAADADLEHAALWAVKIGRLHNSGQSCCAVKRVYCHASVYDEFVQRANAIMSAEVSGDPLATETTLGPLFGGERAVQGLQAMIDDAVCKGAEIICGGRSERIGQALFLQPTLLAGCDHSMQVMREETFGPLLPVMRVVDDEQAIGQVTDTRYGLTSSIFTRSRARAEHYIQAMQSGTVYVNACNFVDARLGWIGHGHSGNGAIALSPLGLQALSTMHSININPEHLHD